MGCFLLALLKLKEQNNFVYYVLIFLSATCRKLNLLSFGEEAEEEEELTAVKKKIKSSHDVLDDPRLLKEDALNKELVIVFICFFAIIFYVILNYDMKIH